jgi:hypothetical protein
MSRFWGVSARAWSWVGMGGIGWVVVAVGVQAGVEVDLQVG